MLSVAGAEELPGASPGSTAFPLHSAAQVGLGVLEGESGQIQGSWCGAHTPSSQAWELHCQSRTSILGIPETIFHGIKDARDFKYH